MLANLKKTFAACPEPVVITDADRQIVYVNLAWEKLTKYTLSEVRGQNPRMLQSRKTSPRIYKQIRRALAAGQGFQTEAMVDQTKAGRELRLHYVIYPIVDHGRARYYIGIMHDITRRRIAEEQKRSLLSLVAHELKTPLTTAKFLVEAFQIKQLHKRSKNKADTIQDVTLIHQQLIRLIRIVDDILNLGRLETSKLQLRLEPTNLHTLVKSVVDQMKLIAPLYQIILQGQCHHLVAADNDRLRQVIVNFLNNARQYSSSKYPIKIMITESPQDIQVCVADQGPGIALKDQSKIFNRYYQVSERTNEGFGLGLYLAKQIIRQHKGKIWVESELGRGSKFFFSLPVIK